VARSIARAKPARSEDRLLYKATSAYSTTTALSATVHQGAATAASASVKAVNNPTESNLPGKCHRRIHHRPGRSAKNPDILTPLSFYECRHARCALLRRIDRL